MLIFTERKVGEGTFAVVYVGEQIPTKRKIAVKMIKAGEFKDGLDMSAIREIKFLQELKHPNVIELLDVYSSETNINLVLEYLPSDLEGLIKDKSVIFGSAEVKSWLLMTLRGIHHCHRNFILHRDLKPGNLLLAPNGVLKIADFGLARAIASPRDPMTPTVVTRWYRAPELLLGARHYTAAVDIWSVGVIFAELMIRTPYLAGSSDAEQANLTFRALGTPTEKTWPGFTSLPGYQKDLPIHPAPTTQELQNRFLAASSSALDLMSGMLTMSPQDRLTADEALLSAYFKEYPPPTKPDQLPKRKETDPNAFEKELREKQRAALKAK